MTSTEQLNDWLRDRDPTYIGTFSLNTVPPMSPNSLFSFIVNTHTVNLPGQHWIAVKSYLGKAWIFDPLAMPPPPPLCNHLLLQCHVNELHICKTEVQSPLTQTCGHHCVYFLLMHKAAPSETVVKLFVNSL